MLYKDVPFETACSSMCITLWIYMRSPMQMIACAAASIRTGHDITYRGMRQGYAVKGRVVCSFPISRGKMYEKPFLTSLSAKTCPKTPYLYLICCKFSIALQTLYL